MSVHKARRDEILVEDVSKVTLRPLRELCYLCGITFNLLSHRGNREVTEDTEKNKIDFHHVSMTYETSSTNEQDGLSLIGTICKKPDTK